MTIDDAYLDERDRLADAATPGPWVTPDGLCVRHQDREPWRPVCLVWDARRTHAEQGVYDLDFIADARTAVPALVAEVRRLRHEGDLMRRSLELQALTLNALLDDNTKLRVKRCHYCDAPMVERPREDDDGGPRYDCSEGCP